MADLPIPDYRKGKFLQEDGLECFKENGRCDEKRILRGYLMINCKIKILECKKDQSIWFYLYKIITFCLSNERWSFCIGGYIL